MVAVPQQRTTSGDVSKKVYIYSLPEHINRETIEKEMAIFGEVFKVKLPIDEQTAKPRSFAFVEYKEEASALKAVATKNIKILDTVVSIIPYKPYKKRYRRRFV